MTATIYVFLDDLEVEAGRWLKPRKWNADNVTHAAERAALPMQRRRQFDMALAGERSSIARIATRSFTVAAWST